MVCKKKLSIIAVVAALSVAATVMVNAATEHYQDSTKNAGWNEWVDEWQNTVSTDYEKVAITPGADETKMNFAWYSKDGATATPIVEIATSDSFYGAQQFTGTAGAAVAGYVTNQVTVSGLRENTRYYYRTYNNGVAGKMNVLNTHSFSEYKMLYVGDPQVGASKGQTTSLGDKLENKSELNTAARNDAFSWNNTLKTAMKENPDISFILSAGDQINKNVTGIDSGNEIEYAGFLNASWLRNIPISTTIGNHDATNKSYSFHFNNPNTTGLGMTEAGGDYYYKYGPAVYIILNTNNYNCAEHEQAVKSAVEAYPDARWRIVMIHQDIYGSGLDHSDSDGIVLRTQLTPIMDRYDIDVVLQGHDHTYSRSYLLKGDGKTHSNYDFYDWDNVKDTAGNVYPYANEVYQADNNCYTITDTTQNKVVDPEGTLYMEANSSTGSKFYELIASQQDYIAARNQNWNPSYSVITLSDSRFVINTYEIADGKVQKIDAAFTIEKTK